jgi:L-malate glycosyltransferase
MSTITGGGVERRRLSLAKYLNKDIFQMKLIGTHKSGKVAEQIEKNGVEIFEIGDFHGPIDFNGHKKVQKIIEDYRPHIIHGAVFEGNTLAAICGFLKKVPIVILEETSDPQNRSWKASFFLKLLTLLSDRIIAISPNVQNYLKNKANVSANKITLINNGVEMPDLIKSKREILESKKNLGIETGDFVIGFVGRFNNNHKRISDLVEAVSLLKNHSYKLLIVGEGKDQKLIEKCIRDFQLNDQVILVGYQFKTSAYFQVMNVLCVPSSREGFGLVAAEAMMHKLPVIASKVGGLVDIIIDNETGFLVPAFSPETIASKIEFLFKNAKIRDKMGENGYQRALQYYHSDRYVKEVENLYRQLIIQKSIEI